MRALLLVLVLVLGACREGGGGDNWDGGTDADEVQCGITGDHRDADFCCQVYSDRCACRYLADDGDPEDVFDYLVIGQEEFVGTPPIEDVEAAADAMAVYTCGALVGSCSDFVLKY